MVCWQGHYTPNQCSRCVKAVRLLLWQLWWPSKMCCEGICQWSESGAWDFHHQSDGGLNECCRGATSHGGGKEGQDA